MSKIEDPDFIINEINFNADVRRVAEYILGKYSEHINLEEAKVIARAMLKQKIKKEDILAGKEDSIIHDAVMAYAVRKGSVIDVDVVEVHDKAPVADVPLKTRKKRVNKAIITVLIVALLGAAACWAYVEIKEVQRDNQISQSLGMLAADVGSFEYESKASIVTQNRYTIGYDENNEAIFAYHNDKIAEGIADVCRKNPELFDLTLNNVYFEMVNRLENMDDVLSRLKNIAAGDESLASVSDRIDKLDVFLEYIFARGFIDPNDPNYYQIMDDIATYKELKTQGAEVPFQALPVDAQRRLQGLVDEFERNQDILYDRYGDVAVDLANGEGLTETSGPGGRIG